MALFLGNDTCGKLGVSLFVCVIIAMIIFIQFDVRLNHL